MNFLYVLGPLESSAWQNNELRYSLRSLDQSDFKADWVGIVGPEIPAFISGITHIKADIEPDMIKYKNVQRQLLVACERAETPENLILMNDDFIIRRTPAWDWTPTYTSTISPLNPKKPGSRWFQTVTATGDWLRGHGIQNPLCYEGHTPMPFLKSLAVPVLRALLDQENSLQFRSAYGNLVGMGGKLHPNAKRRSPKAWPVDSPFWSLKGRPTDAAKTFLEDWLDKPSRWEAQ